MRRRKYPLPPEEKIAEPIKPLFNWKSLNKQLSPILFLIIMAQISALIIGVLSSGHPYPNYESRCQFTPRRIEVLFPAYQLGCFLGSQSGEENYYGKGTQAR